LSSGLPSAAPYLAASHSPIAKVDHVGFIIMKLIGTALVCILTLYAVDAIFCDGTYLAAFNEIVSRAAR
jgi:hypothetical protein